MTDSVVSEAIGKESAFLRSLRQRVDTYFTESKRSRFGGVGMFVKGAVLLLTFVGLYALILTDRFHGMPLLGLAILWACSAALVVFNIPHDAVHGCLSQHRSINRVMSYGFNLVGMNAYTWRIKHNVAHHGFTNVPDYDPDIEAAPILRFSPKDPRYAYHRFQHLYAPLAYMLLGLVVVFVVDFRLLFDRAFAKRHNLRHPIREYVILIATKIFYVGYTLVVPLIVLSMPAWQVAVGWVIVHAVIGLLAALVLLPSHCMEHAVFRDHDAKLSPEGWALAQVETTLDFAPESPIANFFLGGFNTNVVHHIFTQISHVHYGELTQILYVTAKEHGIKVHAMSLTSAIRSHFRFLKSMGSA